MRRHVWRPLGIALALALLIVLGGRIYVPADFGSQERGYMYGFHRQGNEAEWRDLPLRYRGSDLCRDCHGEKLQALLASPHRSLPCENCHGPAQEHPETPEKLVIDRSRDLCLRCHARLSLPGSGRAPLPGIDSGQHNPDLPCSDCHNPHHPNLEEM